MNPETPRLKQNRTEAASSFSRSLISPTLASKHLPSAIRLSGTSPALTGLWVGCAKMPVAGTFGPASPFLPGRSLGRRPTEKTSAANGKR